MLSKLLASRALPTRFVRGVNTLPKYNSAGQYGMFYAIPAMAIVAAGMVSLYNVSPLKDTERWDKSYTEKYQNKK